ncbi:ARM repeat-containing protein [Atractiella rhizophila]|nr:ARM repeat-containing protein [Atractiella rhizophila]
MTESLERRRATAPSLVVVKVSFKVLGFIHRASTKGTEVLDVRLMLRLLRHSEFFICSQQKGLDLAPSQHDPRIRKQPVEFENNNVPLNDVVERDSYAHKKTSGGNSDQVEVGVECQLLNSFLHFNDKNNKKPLNYQRNRDDDNSSMLEDSFPDRVRSFDLHFRIGNYVIQHCLDLSNVNFTGTIVRQFLGNISALSIQRFSSNIVEKCIRAADPDEKRAIIDEILADNGVGRLLLDPFGNYVCQTALDYDDRGQWDKLVGQIKPILPKIRDTPYVRKIQSKIAGEGKHQMNGGGGFHQRLGVGGIPPMAHGSSWCLSCPLSPVRPDPSSPFLWLAAIHLCGWIST